MIRKIFNRVYIQRLTVQKDHFWHAWIFYGETYGRFKEQNVNCRLDRLDKLQRLVWDCLLCPLAVLNSWVVGNFDLLLGQRLPYLAFFVCSLLQRHFSRGYTH